MNSQNASCPLVSLKVAINLAQKIYRIDKADPATKLDIAKAMNYGSLNGASYSRIADLIEYGLLENFEGDQLKLTVEALDIVLSLKGGDKRKKAVLKAAFTPSMFHELNNLYGAKLPDNADLESNLKKMGLHQNKVNHAIRAYRDTVEFIIEETSVDALEPQGNQSAKESIQTETLKNYQDGSDKNNSTLSSQINQGEEGELTWKMAEDFIQIGYKGHVTQKTLQRLMRYAQVNLDDYPLGENQEEEEWTWKIGRNFILVSYTGHVTQKTLHRLVRNLQERMDDYPDMEKAVS